MGHVFRRGNKLWIAYKGPEGERCRHATPFKVGEEQQAKKLLGTVEAKVAAGLVPDVGPLTFERYARRWISRRKALGLADWENDESRLRLHVIPAIGKVPLDAIRPLHLVEVFQDLRTKRAPKTVRNVYSVVTALFRDALIEDLIPSSPCVLTKYQLGPVEDADSEWRATALFTRDELEKLIKDERIPADRRMLYALQGIGALRHGEAAGLRWRHYEAKLKPLGRLIVATSYDKGRTKTGRTRYMPVHPTLAAMLAEWKLRGWKAMMGRVPGPDDLVVPFPQSERIKAGTMRNKGVSYKRLCRDMETLGLRHRRGHDLRRTMISLARADGARGDILELCTHNPRKRASTVDLYTTFPWESLCAEVAKLKVSRGPRGEVLALPLAVGGDCADSADTAPRVSATTVAGGGTQVEPHGLTTCSNHEGNRMEAPGVEPKK